VGKDGDEGRWSGNNGVAWNGAWRTVSIMPAASGDERHDECVTHGATYSSARRHARPRGMWVLLVAVQMRRRTRTNG